LLSPDASPTRDALILRHRRLVGRIASNYQWSPLSLDDLVGEGIVGLIHAVDIFSPEYGVPFARFAAIWIRSYIRKAVRKSLVPDRGGFDFDFGAVPDKPAPVDETTDRVWDAIESLPPPDQHILLCIFGFDGEEPLGRRRVARELGIGVKTVRRSTRRSLVALKAKLRA
jgi:RNA polymerase sigma factor (sigma-70 family)